jgi:XTP/dITP diphosphohydrolase
MRIFFVTSNKGKFKEARQIFGNALEMVDINLEEPRGTLDWIAMHKALHAYSIVKEPLFVEDSGLFISSLNGFPGEFSNWVIKKIGLDGVLRLVPEHDRKAYFMSVVAYVSKEDGIRIFKGRIDGFISESVRGEHGFGYDPIFIPEGYNKTFGEDDDIKSKISHRVKALQALKDFLKHKEEKSVRM